MPTAQASVALFLSRRLRSRASLVIAAVVIGCGGGCGVEAKVADRIAVEDVSLVDKIEAANTRLALRLEDKIDSTTEQAIDATNKVGRDLDQVITTSSKTTIGLTGPWIVALLVGLALVGAACFVVAVWLIVRWLRCQFQKHGYTPENWKKKIVEFQGSTVSRSMRD
jgi:predicted PurR-regulated permease PerM